MNIAIIGFGGMGEYHYRQMIKSKLFNIIGVFDIKKERQDYARKLGMISYASYKELLNDNNIQSVLVATPNDFHAFYVKECANFKKHVICEKPVALSSGELNDMIEVANNNKIIFTVNQNRRYDKDFLVIKKVISDYPIGKTYKVVSNVMGSHGIPGDWRKIKSQGGGMIFDWGVHLVDQALMMFDEKITAIYCKNSYILGHDVDDGTFIILYFSNGVEYHINIETNSFISLPRWLLYGENGTAVIKNWALQGKAIFVKEKIDLKNKGIKAGNGFTKTMADRSKSTIVKKRLPKIKTDGYALYKNFIQSVNRSQTTIVTHSQLSRVLQVLEVAFRSAEKNEVLKVDI